MNDQIKNMTEEEKQQFQLQLKQKLGLPADASDFEVEAALVVVVASMADANAKQTKEMQGRLNEAAQAQEQIANREIDSYKDVVVPEQRTFWVAQLLANREATLAVLDGMRAKLAAANAARLSNRVTTFGRGTPTDTGATGAALAESAKRAVQLRNRAAQLQTQFGMTFQDAWSRAESEIQKIVEG